MKLTDTIKNILFFWLTERSNVCFAFFKKYHLGFYEEHKGDSSPEKVFVNLHRINKDFYQYVRSYSAYQNTNGNPLAEPVNIMTNVNNGFGFFSAYSTVKDSVIIDYSSAGN